MIKFGYLSEDNTSLSSLNFFKGSELNEKDIGKKVFLIHMEFIACGIVNKMGNCLVINEADCLNSSYVGTSVISQSLVAYDTIGLIDLVFNIRKKEQGN